MTTLATANPIYSHFKQSIYLNKTHKLRRHKKYYLYKKKKKIPVDFCACGIFIPLFQSSQTEINLRTHIIYSETATSTIDNSNTIDHILRSINIHRALRICRVLVGLLEVGEMRRFEELSKPNDSFTQCLMTKQATNATRILFSICVDGVGLQERSFSTCLFPGAGFTSPSACQQS